MKKYILFLQLFYSLVSLGQKVYFPKSDFTNSVNYHHGISTLSSNIIPLYTNTDRAGYFNDLFRLQFAKNDYKATIQALDSFAALAIPDKAYRYVAGFHYRIHCLAMMALQANASAVYDKEYEKAFTSLYPALPADGKDQAQGIYEKANTTDEKAKFIALAKKYAAGTDSISTTDAVAFIRQWNYWQVYEKTLSLAKQILAGYTIAEKANEENKKLGLDEGAIISPGAKTYITNVTVMDVEKQKLLHNSTVEITGDNITAVTQSLKTTIYKDATVIDGTGKYLLPGLTDGHIHFFQSGGLYTRPDGLDLRKYQPYEKEIEWTHLNMKDALKRYIMNGITSVIDVGATNNFLQLRDKYRGKTFAPSVYITGPLLTTEEPEVFKKLGSDEPFSLVTTEEEGRKMVQQQLSYHPDFIKIWYILEQGKDKEQSARRYLPVIKAIIDEAHKNNLKVAIHATERISAQLAAENGCDYLVHSVDDEIITTAFAKLLKEKNISLCPTLVVYGNYGKVFGQQLNFSAYELKNANPVQTGSLDDLKHLPEQGMINGYKNSVRSGKAIYDKQDSICLVNLKILSDAGVRIIAGTDAGNTGTLHGTSLLNELKAMKKSGISNWQVLQSATINPAYFLGTERNTGSITAGKIADMVLLKANPLDDLQNLEQISLVINKGHVIKPDTLIKETALALVQRQVNAYNARNLEAFLEPYAEDIELYSFPDKLLSKGKEAMRKDYAFFNDVPDLHCEIKERIIQGNIIIDKESVVGFGSKPVEATAIYYIEGNKIKKVYFIQK